MFNYFGYGSNMDLTAMRAKGVRPVSSERALLRGWELLFNVRHFFRHEGGVANIRQTNHPQDRVLGVVHECHDDALAQLDRCEAFGVGYDRIELEVEISKGTRTSIAYVGRPAFLDDGCLPSQRYLNILIQGAQAAGLDENYIKELREHPVHKRKSYPAFTHPLSPTPTFTSETLPGFPHYTALAGAVFDMSGARPEHEYLKGLFGGKDMTLFHLKRMDTSDGSETLEDLRDGRLNVQQQEYLNEYLQEYAQEYRYVGRFTYG